VSGAPAASELLEGALEALGPGGDERAAELLVGCELEVLAGVSRWEGSDGEVLAHRVFVGTDARSLGRLAAHPSIDDAVVEALGAALARRPGNSLDGVVYHWALDEPQQAAYRGSPRRSAALDDEGAVATALLAYLEGAEQPEAAAMAAHVAAIRVTHAGKARVAHVPVGGAARSFPWPGGSSRGEIGGADSRAARLLITSALESLLAGSERLHVRVEFLAG
jgi:hypothetical protein